MCSILRMRFFRFRKEPGLVRERIFASSRLGAALVVVDLELVVRGDFGRQHFGREIERHARFRFRLVLREPFLHQLAEFGIAAASDRGPLPARARANDNR